MRGGVLIIGSLLWDDRHRDLWRRSRLCISEKVHVRAPICYGRRSQRNWGNTFTMTLSADDPPGQATLVPCTAIIENIAGLIAEAEALWSAEHSNASQGSIGASWGCVGVLFRDESVHPDWSAAWAEHFHSKTSPVSPVDDRGILHIPWPLTASEARRVDVDVVLATATKAEDQRPSAADIADAWLGQHNGHERYFFENVSHGIRTPDDVLIWRRIEERGPSWLRCRAYAEAVAILQAEAAQCG